MAKPRGPIVGNCANPKCRAQISLDHDYSWCIKCGEPLPQETVVVLPKLHKHAGEHERAAQHPGLEERARTDSRLALQPYLNPGEQLINWAYGIEMRGCLFAAIFFALSIPAALIVWLLFGAQSGLLGTLLFFVLWWAAATPVIVKLRKDYILGLTDQRLLVARLKTPLLTRVNFKEAVSIFSFELTSLPPVTSKQSRRKIQIKISHAGGGFDAAFPGGVFGINYDHASQIAASLRPTSAPSHSQ